MIGASALIECAADNGTPTTEPIDWFEVKTDGTTGGKIVAPAGTSWINNGEKFEVESDLEHLVSFEPTDSLTQKMAQVSFTLDAAIVPDALPSLTDKAKVAFAINEAGFNAWNGSAWVQLTGATVPTEGTSFVLLVEFDNREATKKVRFSVGGTPLTYGGNEWIIYSSAVTETVKVGFAGSGMIASFKGDQIKVTAEIIPVGDDGAIIIKEEDLAKFKNSLPAGYDKVDDFIADDASKAFGSSFATPNITVGEAYALGLVADNGSGTMAPVDGGELKAHAVAQANNAKGIELGLNVTPPANTGATITYAVYNGNEKVSDECIIPNSALSRGLKTFKVQAIVTPAPVATTK